MFVANNINIDTRNKFNHGPLVLALATVTTAISTSTSTLTTLTTSTTMGLLRFEIIFALLSSRLFSQLDSTRSVCLPPQTFNAFIIFTTAVLCAQQHPHSLPFFLSFSTNYHYASLFNKEEEYPSKSTFVSVEHWSNIHHPVSGSLHCHSGNYSISTLPSSSSHLFDAQPLNPSDTLTHLLARDD